MDIITSQIPPMPIFIAGGKATFRKGEKHFERVFHIFDLIYVTRGELFMVDGGIKYKLTKGEYIILPPGRKHGGYEVCQEETQYYWVHFSFPNPFYLMKKIEIDWSKIIIKDSTINEPAHLILHLPSWGNVKNNTRAEEGFEKMLDIHESNEPSDKLKAQVIFSELLIFLQQEAVEIPSSAETVAQEAVKYIRDHFALEGFTVKRMAQDLLYHPDYLTRSMKRAFGLTPIQYLNYYRLSVAKKRLVKENIDLATVAKECGFTDVSYFSRVFKVKEGVTPGEYRRMKRSYEKKGTEQQ